MLAGGAALLALVVAAVPLAGLAHQSPNASGGSVPVWLVAPFGVIGLVVAWRRPGNPLGWIMLFGLVVTLFPAAGCRRHGGGG